MGLVFVKRSSIPVSAKGKVASDPAITITSNGQMRLNSLATKFLGDKLLVGIAVDSTDGKIVILRRDNKQAAKMAESEMFSFSVGKKSKNANMTISNLLNSAETFGSHIYDYKASGDQSFPVTLDEKTGTMTFTLPKGALTPKPKVARGPRKKKVSAGTVANPGSTQGTPVNAAKEPEVEELVIDAA